MLVRPVARDGGNIHLSVAEESGRLADKPATPEFEEALGTGTDVRLRVMGGGMGVAEEMVVQLGQGGPLVPPAIPGEAADVGGALHSAERREGERFSSAASRAYSFRMMGRS